MHLQFHTIVELSTHRYNYQGIEGMLKITYIDLNQKHQEEISFLHFHFFKAFLTIYNQRKYKNKKITIIIISLFWEFFLPALADGFSLESEWQQASLSLHSGWSQQCCSLDGLYLSYYFQVLQSLYQSFSNCTEHADYSWYHYLFHVP